ncbi:hypothetical protein AHF37_11635 [Paragonimus kellicotti]|nr:hypothetical protein AHF37_11635 [Paragonimus kellicotti]
MKAKLTLPPADDDNVCMQLRAHIARVTATDTEKQTTTNTKWVAIKQVFLDESLQTVSSSFCSGPSGTAVEPRRVTCSTESACNYAELASGDQGSLGMHTSTRAINCQFHPTPNHNRFCSVHASSVGRVSRPHMLPQSMMHPNPLLEKELAVMKSAGIHPNVVTLIGRCTLPVFGAVLVLEYCPRGNLRAYLRSLRSSLTPNQAETPQLQKQLYTYVSQIAEGMRYLSSRNVSFWNVFSKMINNFLAKFYFKKILMVNTVISCVECPADYVCLPDHNVSDSMASFIVHIPFTKFRRNICLFPRLRLPQVVATCLIATLSNGSELIQHQFCLMFVIVIGVPIRN